MRSVVPRWHAATGTERVYQKVAIAAIIKNFQKDRLHVNTPMTPRIIP